MPQGHAAISEEHVRGVKTNIPFVTNILATHLPAGACHTKFIDETPELFDIDVGRDRATKLLKYIAQIQVDNPSARAGPRSTFPASRPTSTPRPSAPASSSFG